ncbi:MAG TPA: site-specific integrase [Noviherbaspirillum sp.]|uniref:tyrosine-type recombinase/integrase n=1 Tax=Noviherbaspirillum sp. TaxID=1926288 RepID=UPI002B47CFF1|nr:site-specific integrase [Noviherbaspirillum sp.]HJV84550.1 site-specific integrase [Noviherbaspirillum sp.]
MWKDKLQALLDEKAGKRVNGKVASHKTAKQTREVLMNFFNTLHELGYRIEDPRNVGERHLRAAVRHWHFVKKLAPKTLEGYISRLRVCFHTWLGKRGLVKHCSHYLPEVPREELVVRTVANKSKTWIEAGIDVPAKLAEADRMNERLGWMLRMELAFGLRRKEALLCRPWVADRGDVLRVYPGEGKGNRPRDIPIETDVQRAVLKAVQAKVGKKEALGWATIVSGKAATLEQKETRYNGYMRRLGLTRIDAGATGHCLRAQFAENKALLENFVPPTLGGTPGQMKQDELTLKKIQVSEVLGHSRPEITGAYYGAMSRFKDDANPEYFVEALTDGLSVLAKHGRLPSPPREALPDCVAVVSIAAEGGVDLTPSQAFALWTAHSLRHGTEWISAKTATPAALAVAARAIVALEERADAETTCAN